MGKREEDPRLKELRDEGIPVYSISRLDSINNCLYSSYRTYILHERGKNNIYAILGGLLHDKLEEIVHGTATEADLLPCVQEELDNLDMLGIEFPKDRDGGDSIRDNWVKDMNHFARTFVAPKNKDLITEEFVLYKTPNKGYYLQGFIDLQWVRPDGSIFILDYKSSSMYSAKDMAEHARQLIVYALAKEQEGKTVNDIAFVFLKYCTVSFMGYKTAKSKERTEIVKHIERRKLYTELEKYFRRDLEELDYDELEIENVLDKASQMLYDSRELPKELKERYTIKPCVVTVELSDETKAEAIKYIEDTVDMWEGLDQNNEFDYPPRKFVKLKNTTGEEALDVFFCTQLCNHFDNCHYVKDFLDQWTDNNDDSDDLF